jgi:hypothetical protein
MSYASCSLRYVHACLHSSTTPRYSDLSLISVFQPTRSA